jgi:hypothetical protein
MVVSASPGVTTTDHVAGLAVAILVHVAIAVHIRQRLAALSAA